MKVEIKNAQRELIKANMTSIGDVMIIRAKKSRYNNYILLRTYEGFAALNSPDTTWNIHIPYLVEVLPKGTVITLTVE